MEKSTEKDTPLDKQANSVTEKSANKPAGKNSAKPATALKQPPEKPNLQNTKMATNRNPNVATKNSTGDAHKHGISKEANVLPVPKDVGSGPTFVSTLENRKGTPNRNKSEHVEMSPDNDKVKDTDPPNNSSAKNGATHKTKHPFACFQLNTGMCAVFKTAKNGRLYSITFDSHKTTSLLSQKLTQIISLLQSFHRFMVSPLYMDCLF